MQLQGLMMLHGGIAVDQCDVYTVCLQRVWISRSATACENLQAIQLTELFDDGALVGPACDMRLPERI